MKRLIAVSMIVLVAAAAVLARGQDGPPSQQEMQEIMMKLATPGEHHGHLAKLAGDFTYTAKAWAQPGAEAQGWTGTRSAKMILGGRFLEEAVDGMFMGMPFNGRGLYAYDNASGQYMTTWVDNMSTTVIRSTGSCSVNGFVLEGTHAVPGVSDENPFTNVIRWVDDNTFVFEWHESVPGQSESFKMMEITYTRK